ncbi:hypothetical protein Tco_0822112 [Tanacetum coccineum]|uniref:Histone deacetylase 14 n=1 Tax=Tanacetum coccineum TaxID=301880 RepID=A0ABQ5AID8_9ASTR
MANENVPAPAPTRSDDQIIPFAAWVPIGKRNLCLGSSKEAKKSNLSDLCTNVDYDELMWEEFVQAIQTFLTDKANLGSPTKKGRKDKAHVIPYCRFTKLIICHLGRKHNLHQRSESLLHLAEEDLRLRNLKFIPKGEVDEVFGMPIPSELITNNIRNAPYYNAYMEMVANHDHKIATEKGGKKKPTTAKQLKLNHVKEKSSKPALAPKHKSSLQLIDEDEPTQPKPEPEPEHQGEGEEYDVERSDTESLGIFQRQESSTCWDDASQLQFVNYPSPADAETGEDVDNQVNLEEKTAKLDQGQAGTDPGEILSLDLHQSSLKFPADEHVILEDPLSSSGTLSSMINLDDAYTIGDQFLNDKSTEDEPGKLNVEAEVVFMVTVPIYQASSLVPPLSTPVIDLSPPKPIPSTTQAPIFTATTVTTTTTLPPPLQQQSTTDSKLAACVTTLEKKFSNFEQKSNTLDNTTRNLGSRVFTLELRDLPYKINQIVNEVVKEAVHSGTYKSLPGHVALYEALVVSMERANKDELFAEKDKSYKRRHDDQDLPPPPPDLDPSKNRRHASDALGSTQPLAPQSSAWKTSDTREAPFNSSRQKSAPHSDQQVKDVPIPDNVNVSDSKDTDTAHLPKIKTRPDWLKHVPEEDRPATPEPDWVSPPNELPETKNNWSNALASLYQDPDEYKLRRKTGNMSSFINWFCKRIGKKKLGKADLEGPAFKLEKDNPADKRRRDDQDPPPPPPDSDLSKKKRHDSDALGSTQPPAPQILNPGKLSDTR